MLVFCSDSYQGLWSLHWQMQMRAVVLLTPEACRVVVWECCVSSPLLQLTVTCTEGTCLCQESMAAQLAQGPWLSSGLSNPFHPSVSVTTVSLSIHWCCRLSYRRASCSSFIVCCGPLLLVFKEKTDEMSSRWMSELAGIHPSAVAPDDQPAICFCEGKCEFI